MTQNAIIRIGLIGLGRHTMRSLLPNILAIPEMSISAVCDTDLEKCDRYSQQMPGVVTFPSAEELVANAKSLDLQAVIISLDPRQHATWARRALEKDLHVFVEKPAAIRGRDLLPLAKIAEQRGLVTMVGTMWRYTATVQLFRRWQQQDPDRRIRQMFLTATFPSGIIREGWDLEGIDMFFYDMFLHGVDFATALVGHPDSVCTYKVDYGERGTKVANQYGVVIVMNHPGGSVSVLNMVTGSHRYHIEVGLALHEGTFVSITDDLTHLSITTQPTWSNTVGSLRDHPALTWEPGQLYRGYARHGYIEELRIFLEAIKTGQQTPTHLQEAAKVLQTLEACIQSVHAGHKVETTTNA